MSSRRVIITDVLGGDLEFPFFHQLFNTLFVLSALLTMTLFYSQYRQQANQDSLHTGIPLYNRAAGPQAVGKSLRSL
jgi:hypothetical protein